MHDTVGRGKGSREAGGGRQAAYAPASARNVTVAGPAATAEAAA